MENVQFCGGGVCVCSNGEKIKRFASYLEILFGEQLANEQEAINSITSRLPVSVRYLLDSCINA